MDQLRTALVWLKKYHFWVLCGLVALIALGSWAKASGKMDVLFGANQAAIKGGFDSVKNLLKDPFHPNEDVNTKQQAQTKQQAADVAKLWQQLYDRQRQHVLEWPVPPLTKEFGDFVDKLQFGAEIRRDLRSNYQNYIEGHFSTLPKQIDARPIDPNTVGSASGAPGGAEFAAGASNQQDDNDYICMWSPADQNIVRDDLNFRDQPSSLKIWVTQENLWVYHTLLDVIAKTNRAANATRMSNAAVQEVGELSVGSRAAAGSRNGRLRIGIAAAAPTGGPGAEGGPGSPPGGGAPPGAGPEGGMRGQMMPGGGPNGGPMTEEQEKAVLLSGRYLGPDGKPIPFGGGGAAAPPGGEAPPTPAPDAGAAGAPLDLTVFGQEYKRLPVRMALKMDQRWLPRLIAECASEPLQIEVQEVRVNPPEGIASAGGAGGVGGGYRPGGEGGIGGGSVFPEEQPIQPFPTQPEIVNVIIQGTIYIFNKPNPVILQAPGDQPAGAQPPPTTAAAQ
ncbi:MAG TPA: hypothetical protein VGI40_10420 [Pirellulaceae bacterium]|jgi:hypothetical protein